MRLAPPGASSGDTSRAARLVRATPLAALIVPALFLAMAGCGTTHFQPIVLPTATQSSVALTTDFSAYEPGQAIGVTVRNSGKQTYFAADNHSECTVLQLQQLVRGVWTDIMPCAAGEQPNLLQIRPGLGVPYTLAPGNAHDSPNAWDPGTYRVALALGAKADGSDMSTMVYSAGFTVKSA